MDYNNSQSQYSQQHSQQYTQQYTQYHHQYTQPQQFNRDLYPSGNVLLDNQHIYDIEPAIPTFGHDPDISSHYLREPNPAHHFANQIIANHGSYLLSIDDLNQPENLAVLERINREEMGNIDNPESYLMSIDDLNHPENLAVLERINREGTNSAPKEFDLKNKGAMSVEPISTNQNGTRSNTHQRLYTFKLEGKDYLLGTKVLECKLPHQNINHQQKKFQTRADLKAHLNNEHKVKITTIRTPAKCRLDACEYKNQSGLHKHIRTHNKSFNFNHSEGQYPDNMVLTINKNKEVSLFSNLNDAQEKGETDIIDLKALETWKGASLSNVTSEAHRPSEARESKKQALYIISSIDGQHSRIIHPKSPLNCKLHHHDNKTKNFARREDLIHHIKEFHKNETTTHKYIYPKVCRLINSSGEQCNFIPKKTSLLKHLKSSVHNNLGSVINHSHGQYPGKIVLAGNSFNDFLSIYPSKKAADKDGYNIILPEDRLPQWDGGLELRNSLENAPAPV